MAWDDFRTVYTGVRPARAAVLIPDGENWIASAV